MNTSIDITAEVHLDGTDVAVQKATALAEKINEAKTLAGELASLMEKLEVKFEFLSLIHI